MTDEFYPTAETENAPLNALSFLSAAYANVLLQMNKIERRRARYEPGVQTEYDCWFSLKAWLEKASKGGK